MFPWTVSWIGKFRDGFSCSGRASPFSEDLHDIEHEHHRRDIKRDEREVEEDGIGIVARGALFLLDQNLEDLNMFLAKNPDMPWPQLFDATNPGWHSLANQYGVDSIPRMFLIDKTGVVRSVEARENFEELIPKLLAE